MNSSCCRCYSTGSARIWHFRSCWASPRSPGCFLPGCLPATACRGDRVVSGHALVLPARGGFVRRLPAAPCPSRHGGTRMNTEFLIAIVTGTVVAATPLIYAALGELIAERAGVLNLGVEGMMLVGALAAFSVGVGSGSLMLGYLAAVCASMLLALLFAVLTVSLQTNQVATGLALTLFGRGLSAFAGRKFTGLPIQGLRALWIPILSHLPIAGPLLFRFDAAVYAPLLPYVPFSHLLTPPPSVL